jgi:imidazolonepropionase-like amidohydrolase
MMRDRYRLGGLLAALVLLAAGSAARAAPAACSLAIVHARLVPMDRERVLPDRTVIVSGRRIAAIGPSTRSGVRGCRRVVDARGRWLAPGLTDSHVHVEADAFRQVFGGKPQAIDFEAVLTPYLAHGVTSIVVMSGEPDILAFRNRANPTDAAVPLIATASPMLAGDPPIIPEPLARIVRTPAEGAAAVHQYAAEGYDFIKVRENLRPEVLSAIIAQARRDRLAVGGHVTHGLTPDQVMAKGQHGFAHLDELARDIGEPKTDADHYASELKACGCWVMTTMAVLSGASAQIEDYDAMLARPAMRYMSPMVVDAFWRKPNNPYFNQSTPASYFRELLAKDQALLTVLIDRGVMVLAGTDALNPMVIPGASMGEEFRLMTAAGLTPYQALRTAVVNPPAAIHGLEGLGALARGRIANLVLLDADPLSETGAYDRPLAVVIKGRWIDRAELDGRMAAVQRKFHP